MLLFQNVLSGSEAQCLANQFQIYYGGLDKTKNHLLETFTNNPASFKHMDLVAQLENITLALWSCEVITVLKLYYRHQISCLLNFLISVFLFIKIGFI